MTKTFVGNEHLINKLESFDYLMIWYLFIIQFYSD